MKRAKVEIYFPDGKLFKEHLLDTAYGDTWEWDSSNLWVKTSKGRFQYSNSFFIYLEEYHTAPKPF